MKASILNQTAQRSGSQTGKHSTVLKLITLSIWPLIGIGSLILLWQVAITVFGVKSFIAPSPFGVVQAIGQNFVTLRSNLAPTALEAVCGFFLGNATAFLMATVFVHSRTIRRMYFPVAVIFNTIPIIALSPILILLFGLTLTSKI